MICYRCGCTLSEKDYCTGCGADVGMYKKILALSNRYYNEALERCQVRDLSGAASCLKQSLKLNKNNVDARNLLGLIYFEIGEVIEALGQWVISKNIRDTKNIATDYIDIMQQNTNHFESMNQTIKRFNQSLDYCYRDGLDFAVITLKKIISTTPKYLRARQLLALIYIKNEAWEDAKHELDKCIRIDANNTTTLRYLQEVESILEPVDSGHMHMTKKKSNAGVQVYQSGNETIIQPINKKESKATSVLLNIGIGILIGIAITYFLILPSKIYAVNETANETVQTISDEKDKKTAELDSMKLTMQKLEQENAELKSKLGDYTSTDGEIKSTDALMMAVNIYMNAPEDVEGIAAALENLETKEGEEKELHSETFEALYDSLLAKYSVQLADYYYDRGYELYRNEDYENAAPDLLRAFLYNKSNEEALFYLGNAYRRIEELDKAKEAYAQVIDLFPGTEKAQKAETYLVEINNQEGAE